MTATALSAQAPAFCPERQSSRASTGTEPFPHPHEPKFGDTNFDSAGDRASEYGAGPCDDRLSEYGGGATGGSHAFVNNVGDAVVELDFLQEQLELIIDSLDGELSIMDVKKELGMDLTDAEIMAVGDLTDAEIMAAVQDSELLRWDETDSKIKPQEVPQCTIIMHEVPESVQYETILSTLRSITRAKMTEIRKDVNHTWLITFRDASDAKKTCEKLRTVVAPWGNGNTTATEAGSFTGVGSTAGATNTDNTQTTSTQQTQSVSTTDKTATDKTVSETTTYILCGLKSEPRRSRVMSRVSSRRSSRAGSVAGSRQSWCFLPSSYAGSFAGSRRASSCWSVVSHGMGVRVLGDENDNFEEMQRRRSSLGGFGELDEETLNRLESAGRQSLEEVGVLGGAGASGMDVDGMNVDGMNRGDFYTPSPPSETSRTERKEANFWTVNYGKNKNKKRTDSRCSAPAEGSQSERRISNYSTSQQELNPLAAAFDPTVCTVKKQTSHTSHTSRRVSSALPKVFYENDNYRKYKSLEVLKICEKLYTGYAANAGVQLQASQKQNDSSGVSGTASGSSGSASSSASNSTQNTTQERQERPAGKKKPTLTVPFPSDFEEFAKKNPTEAKAMFTIKKVASLKMEGVFSTWVDNGLMKHYPGERTGSSKNKENKDNTKENKDDRGDKSGENKGEGRRSGTRVSKNSAGVGEGRVSRGSENVQAVNQGVNQTGGSTNGSGSSSSVSTGGNENIVENTTQDTQAAGVRTEVAPPPTRNWAGVVTGAAAAGGA